MHGAAKRIGVLGGTFDPPHVGHVVAAVNARHQLELELLLVVPANTPWQKAGARPVSPPAERLALVQLAFADLAGISVTSMEIERGGNSYTIDTVDALQAADPDRAVFVIVGGDIAPHLDTWHRADELRRRCTIAVYDRPGSGGLPPEGWVVEHLALPQLDVSSTDVRSRCAAGLPIDGLVPPAVAQYLRAHPLYAPTQAVAGR